MRISQNQYACVGFHGKATLHSSAKLIKTVKNLVQLVHLVWLTIARQHNTQMHESRHTHTCNFRFIVTLPSLSAASECRKQTYGGAKR